MISRGLIFFLSITWYINSINAIEQYNPQSNPENPLNPALVINITAVKVCSDARVASSVCSITLNQKDLISGKSSMSIVVQTYKQDAIIKQVENLLNKFS